MEAVSGCTDPRQSGDGLFRFHIQSQERDIRSLWSMAESRADLILISPFRTRVTPTASSAINCSQTSLRARIDANNRRAHILRRANAVRISGRDPVSANRRFRKPDGEVAAFLRVSSKTIFHADLQITDQP